MFMHYRERVGRDCDDLTKAKVELERLTYRLLFTFDKFILMLASMLRAGLSSFFFCESEYKVILMTIHQRPCS